VKKTFLAVAALLLAAGTASASPTVMKWTAGWNNFTEPLDYTKSKTTWSVNPTSRKLSLTFTLVGAKPSKLYQVGITFFCTSFPATFGQFPVNPAGGNCGPFTYQGVTKTVAWTEVGVVTTDIHGNGFFTVVIGPVPSGTYDVELYARDGAGCDLTGGGYDCKIDFQSPGPTFGDATTITIP